MFGFYPDGEYYVVRFNDGTYYKGAGLYVEEQQTTDISKAQLYQLDWRIDKDIYLKQFLYGKDLICEYMPVKVKTTVEVEEIQK